MVRCVIRLSVTRCVVAKWYVVGCWQWYCWIRHWKVPVGLSVVTMHATCSGLATICNASILGEFNQVAVNHLIMYLG